MSAELWAFDDLKCDGAPCGGSCDVCPIKDEHRCYECKHFNDTGLFSAGTYGNCRKYGDTTNAVDKACDDFEEREE